VTFASTGAQFRKHSACGVHCRGAMADSNDKTRRPKTGKDRSSRGLCVVLETSSGDL
jgi:hypothetical protein